MRRNAVDLLVVMSVAVVATALAFIPIGWIPLRIALAIPLVLFLPGYALTAALFPTRALDLAERLAFILGLSLAGTVLGGVALNLTPWGLEARSWAILLSSVTLGAGVVALVRRRGYPEANACPVSIGINVRQAILFGLAVLIAVTAVGVASVGASRQQSSRFTQLWILSANQADRDAVQLGIRSMERTHVTYRLVLTTGGTIIEEWPAIDIAPGGEWETTVILPAAQPGISPVEASLYRLDSSESIYRHVTLSRDGEATPVSK